MKHRETIVARAGRGEEIVSFIAAIAKREAVRAASVSGIGVLRNSELGYFDYEKKKYLKKILPDEMELLSLAGNVTVSEGEPFVHCHAVLSGRDFQTAGGHLFRGEVAVTAEVFIQVLEGEITRTFNPATSLRLMDL